MKLLRSYFFSSFNDLLIFCGNQHFEQLFSIHVTLGRSWFLQFTAVNFTCSCVFVTAHTLVLIADYLFFVYDMYDNNEGCACLKLRTQLHMRGCKNVHYNSIKNEHHQCIGFGFQLDFLIRGTAVSALVRY